MTTIDKVDNAVAVIETFNNASVIETYKKNGRHYIGFVASSFAVEGIQDELGKTAFNQMGNKYVISY